MNPSILSKNHLTKTNNVMINITNMVGENSIANQVRRWNDASFTEFPRFFQRFFLMDSTLGPLDPGLFLRLSGIDFGEVNTDIQAPNFFDEVQGDGPLSMTLGLFEYSNEATPGTDFSFNVFFQSGNNTTTQSPQFFGLVNPAQIGAPTGFFYNLASQPSTEFAGGPVKPHIGILPEVKNHLQVNWLMSQLDNVGIIFSAQGSRDSVRSNINEASTATRIQSAANSPFESMLFRTLRYPITMYNRDALRQVLQPDSRVLIHFGMVPADFFFNEPVFSPIIEVRNPPSQPSQMLVTLTANESVSVGNAFKGTLRVTLPNNDPFDIKAIIGPTGPGSGPKDYLVHTQVENINVDINFKIEGTTVNSGQVFNPSSINNQTESFFLDFVGGCPPACP